MTNGIKKKILLVDDEDTFRDATAELINTANFNCDASSNAHDALKLIMESKYDLLISDYNMPGNINLDFIKKVRKIDKYLSIILLTGYPNLKSVFEGVNLSVDAYLVKPLEFEDLLYQIKKILENENIKPDSNESG